jgi:AraC-like DNA-binding protein
VNVSPDKRNILLHDQNILLDNLKVSQGRITQIIQLLTYLELLDGIIREAGPNGASDSTAATEIAIIQEADCSPRDLYRCFNGQYE